MKWSKLEAGLNKLRVQELRAKVERQAKEITRLELSRAGLKKHNKELREEQGHTHVKVDFSGSAYETLSSLAKAKGKTKTTIICEALAFEVWLQETQESGGRILVERDGEAREIVRL